MVWILLEVIKLIMPRYLSIILFSLFITINLKAQPTFGTSPFISFNGGAFTISEGGKSAPLFVSSHEWPGVIRAFKDLQTDIGKVTSTLPAILTDQVPKSKEIIIAGTIGKSPVIDEMIRKKKLAVNDISGKWEAFSIQIVRRPMKGVKKALVIAGSDKRGTIYGIYELSKKIGVSPWYWWADVTPEHRDVLCRGIYIPGPSLGEIPGHFSE